MPQSLTIVYYPKTINDRINLPLSKSLSNRLLMIYALMSWPMDRLKLSQADDTVLLKSLLSTIAKNEVDDFEDDPLQLNCKNAGTTLRFLSPYLSILTKEYMLTGSSRMQERPIGPLVDALRKLGADIRYVNKDGFPPIIIKPANIAYTDIVMDASKSSQFASAILLLLPLLSDEAKLRFIGKISSRPYIEMTLDLMTYFGIKYSFDKLELILKGKYLLPKKEFIVEADWSSASYWYEVLSMTRGGELFIQNLKIKSLQGDRILAEIYASLGVQTYQEKDGIRIKAEGEVSYNQNIDFKNYPDIALSVIASCAALGVMGKFSGLESLNLKESRRMDMLCSELGKLDFDLRDNGFGEYVLINPCRIENRSYDFSNIVIQTAGDHRMAMAFAPFAIIGKSICISDANSVNKSYPMFWDELLKIAKVY